jgi:signal transduction histidine kinase
MKIALGVLAARASGEVQGPTRFSGGDVMGGHRLPLPLGCGLAGWCALALVWPHLAPGGADALSTASYAAVAGAFVIAGVAERAWARVSGQPRADWTGTALIVAGSAMLLLGGLQMPVHPAPDGLRPLPAVRAAVLIPMLVLFALSARSRPPLRPSRWLLPSAVGSYAIVGLALSTPGVSAVSQRYDGSSTWLVVEAALGGSWLLLATRRNGRQAALWSLPLLLMGAGDLSYAVSLRAGPFPEELAAGFTLAAAGVFLVSAAIRLRAAVTSSSRRMLQLDAELDQAQAKLKVTERCEAERLHDARTAALGIEAAVVKLADDGANPELAQMVNAELRRLLGLLGNAGPDGAEPPRAFGLSEALGPVLAVRHSLAPPVIADLGAHHAFGRPAATARALANVLTNASTHAQATTVAVHAETADQEVVITVDDDGRGIPESMRTVVLGPGTRGDQPQTPGQGLGLYTAARAMADQGGSLRVAERPGGGTRITLILPVDPTSPSPAAD